MERISILPIRIKVASVLRKALLSGEYEEGTELSLTDVAAELGVSRTPVREAFQTLASEGLLTLRMNKGAIVNGINEKFVREHFELRMALESEAVALTTDRCNQFEDLEALQKEAEDPNSPSFDYNLYNQQFHTFIWEHANNEKLNNLLQTLWNGPSRARHDNTHTHEGLSIKEHRQILDFMEKRDKVSAVSVMRTHIERSMNNVLGDLREKKN